MGPRRPLTTWPRVWRRRGKRGLWAMFLLACGFLLMGPALTGWATTLLQGPHRGPYPPTTDACASCHRSHTARRADLLITGGGGGGGWNPALMPMTGDEQFCFTCHNGTGAAQTAVVSAHGNMAPLADDGGHAAHDRPVFRIGCTACHDPHGSPNAQDIRTDVVLPHFSRAQRERLGPVIFRGATGKYSFDDGESPPSSRLCVVCHQAVGTLRHPGGADHLGHFDFTGQNCLTCHPHSVDGIPATADGFMPSPEARQQLIGRARVDLEVRQHGSEESVVAGKPFTHVLEVSNHGPQDAWEVRLTVALPRGVTVSQMPVGVKCTREGAQLVCLLGDLPVGEHRALALTLLPEATLSGELVGEATVAALQRDPHPENNHLTFSLPCERQADLAVALAAAPKGNLLPGKGAKLVLSVSNRGPSLASQVVARVALPSALRFVEGRAEGEQAAPQCQWEEDAAGQRPPAIVCRWEGLQPGESVTVTLVVVEEKAAGQEVEVVARGTSQVADLWPENNLARWVWKPALPTPTPTPTPTPAGSPTVTPTPTPTPTPLPTGTPTPDASPTATPTLPSPTPTPDGGPTPTPTPAPTATGTPTPHASPTPLPTVTPTFTPTTTATSSPTLAPTTSTPTP